MELVYRTIIPDRVYQKVNYRELAYNNGTRLSNHYPQWSLLSGKLLGLEVMMMELVYRTIIPDRVYQKVNYQD